MLESPVAKAKAQQILDIINPGIQDKGKVFDPCYNRPARFNMPRLFVNNTGQKLIRQYKHFDDLPLSQFIEGFSIMIDREKSPQIKSYMLAHLSEIVVILHDFSWEVVREWSNTILSDIGQGFYKWSDGHKIEKQRVMKLMSAGTGSGNTEGRNACLSFNATKCSEIASHATNFLHVCSFCLAIFNAEHDHPVIACNKRLYFKKGKDRNTEHYLRPHLMDHETSEIPQSLIVGSPWSGETTE